MENAHRDYATFDAIASRRAQGVLNHPTCDKILVFKTRTEIESSCFVTTDRHVLVTLQHCDESGKTRKKDKKRKRKHNIDSSIV